MVGEAHRIPSGFSVRMGGQVRWESPEQSSSQEERSRKEPTRDADKMNIVIFLSPLIRQSNVLFPFSSHVITRLLRRSSPMDRAILHMKIPTAPCSAPVAAGAPLPAHARPGQTPATTRGPQNPDVFGAVKQNTKTKRNGPESKQ